MVFAPSLRFGRFAMGENITAGQAAPLPAARVAVDVRVGTPGDLPFIDALMKRHSKQLAFLTRQTLEGKIALGQVLVAEVRTERHEGTEARRHTGADEAGASAASPFVPSSLRASVPVPAGYLIGNDRYKSRDELGVIFQICVAPEFRRMLVGAHLVKKQFERSAYGCRLYCCWCAQDLTESNRFYESLGFVPLAFRAGSEKRNRVHIFWQKRVRAGDTTTPWWFPSETRGGLMDASRIALPIPPGMTWRDDLPRLLPTIEGPPQIEQTTTPRASRRPRVEKPRVGGGFYFGPPPTVQAETSTAKPKRVKRADPALAAKARELRDKYLEQFNTAPAPLLLGKYDVAREGRAGVELIDAPVEAAPTKLLAA
jgi:ribosomal protein S18 acetylase RimI-like enzyme